MSISYFPFTSVSGDRKVTAADFRRYWAGFATSGIIEGQLNECMCSINGMNVVVNTGIAHIQGALGIVNSAESVSVSPTAAARYATVVLELNDNSNQRNIHCGVIYGSSTTPAVPTQTAAVWQLPLCTLLVPANAATLAGVDIIDDRAYAMLRLASENSRKPISYVKSTIWRTASGALMGDVNKDGKVNGADVTALNQYIANGGLGIDRDAADLNGDGTADNSDLVSLAGHVNRMGDATAISRVVVTYRDGTSESFYGYVDAPNGN